MVAVDRGPRRWSGGSLRRGRLVGLGWTPRLRTGDRVLGQEEEEEAAAAIETCRAALGSR